MRRVFLAAAMLVVVAGCARHWARPGGTDAELDAAKANCEVESFTRFPRVMQTTMVSPGYISPVTSNCAPGPNGPRCVTVGGEFVPPTYSAIDLNQSARRSAYDACLMAGGWQVAKDKEEAEAITRSIPRPTPEAPR